MANQVPVGKMEKNYRQEQPMNGLQVRSKFYQKITKNNECSNNETEKYKHHNEDIPSMGDATGAGGVTKHPVSFSSVALTDEPTQTVSSSIFVSTSICSLA
jgi:hypothetical protein